MPLARLTTLGLGGPANRVIEAARETTLVAAILDAGDNVLVLGGGSNVVISDTGFPGTVVLVRTRELSIEGNRLTAAAGVPWDLVVNAAVTAGLAGIEALSGIPGFDGRDPGAERRRLRPGHLPDPRPGAGTGPQQW